MPLLLGLDIGTTSTIGILIDESGATLAMASRPADTPFRPRQLVGGGRGAVVEQQRRHRR